MLIIFVVTKFIVVALDAKRSFLFKTLYALINII